MVVKVSILVVIEIGIFPLVCGWWLDICSLVSLQNSALYLLSILQKFHPMLTLSIQISAMNDCTKF